MTFGYHVGELGRAFFSVIPPDGYPLALGYNAQGQLGIGANASSMSPMKVQGVPSDDRIVQGFANKSSGVVTTFYTTKSGKLYGTGYNAQGQLGIGIHGPLSTMLKQVDLPSDVYVEQVVPARFATFIVTTDGKLYGMGSCVNYMLSPLCGSTKDITTTIDSPRYIALPNDERIAPNTSSDRPNSVITDAYSVFVRTTSGKVYGWRENRSGQVATGDKNPVVGVRQVGDFGEPEKTSAMSIATDGQAIFVIDSVADAYVAGGQNWKYSVFLEPPVDTITNSGGGLTSLRKIPIPADGSKERKARKISIDELSAVLLATDGTVWVSGENTSGQLGVDSTSCGNIKDDSTCVTAMTQVPNPDNKKIIDVYTTATKAYDFSTSANTFLIAEDGNVYGAGDNQFGQLGLGYESTREFNFRRMNFDKPVKTIIAGSGTTVILMRDHSLYSVGNNRFGQLGDKTTINRSTPVANFYARYTRDLIY